MQCKICREKAEIHLRSHNIALCRRDFITFFERKVKRSIASWKMFTPTDKVLVAVSGGKDSLGLLHLLKKLDYRVTGYFIHLGIDGYSDLSLEKVRQSSKARGIPIIVEEVRAQWGKGIGPVAKEVRRSPCSLCGMVKRYLMNSAAKDFDVIATGHNLGDEAATLLGNVLRWEVGYLSRQSPVLEQKNGLQKKVKPLGFVTERESAAYAFMEGIDYVMEECPLATGATSLFYKDILTRIEEGMPGTMPRFFKGFLKFQREYLREEQEEDLKPCVLCGYVTTAEICNFCRVEEKLRR